MRLFSSNLVVSFKSVHQVDGFEFSIIVDWEELVPARCVRVCPYPKLAVELLNVSVEAADSLSFDFESPNRTTTSELFEQRHQQSLTSGHFLSMHSRMNAA